MTEQESSPCDHVTGTCHCIPGYTGESCEEGKMFITRHMILSDYALKTSVTYFNQQNVPDGSYGQDCLEVCQCQNGASCDVVTGMCNCTAGWQGSSCNICNNLLYNVAVLTATPFAKRGWHYNVLVELLAYVCVLCSLNLRLRGWPLREKLSTQL